MLAERDMRYQRIRQALAQANLDGLLAWAPGWRRENVRYLAGAALRGSFALAYLPLVGEAAAFACAAEDRAAMVRQGWVSDVRPLALPAMAEVTARLNTGTAPRRLGVAHLELMPAAAVAALSAALPATELVSATALLNRVRLVKSDWELTQIRRAGVVCAAGWEAFVAAMKPGVAEHEIIAGVEHELKRLGAEDNFMLIASGGTEVMGMTPPTPRRLQWGDLVRTELTPQMNGYWAQICRTAVLGEPNPNQVRSAELFIEALEAGLAVCKAGVTAHEIARAENDVFRKYGYGQYCTSQYTRVRGHGHGLHLDEIPAIVEGDETVLAENAVVIVHPNTYTPLAGYMVMGDPVVITKNGYELLLNTERRLFVAS